MTFVKWGQDYSAVPEQDAPEGVEPGRPVQRPGPGPAEAVRRQPLSGQVQVS